MLESHDDDASLPSTSKRRPPEPTILRAHEAGVHAVAFLDEEQLVTGDSDGHVKLWDLGSCRPRLSWMPSPYSHAHIHATTTAPTTMKGILSLHPWQEGQQLLTQLRGGTVTLWDMGAEGGQPRPTTSFTTGAFHFCKVATARTKNQTLTPLLLTPSAESEQFHLWDLRQDTNKGATHTFIPPGPAGINRGLCMCLHLHTDPSTRTPTYALAAYEDGSLHAYDLRKLSAAAAISTKLTSKETPLSLDVGPSGRRGVLGSAGAEIVVFDLDLPGHQLPHTHSQTHTNTEAETQTQTPTKKLITLKHPGVADVKIREDEKLFATAGWDHRVRVYRYQDTVPLAVLKGHTESVYALAFSPGDGGGGGGGDSYAHTRTYTHGGGGGGGDLGTLASGSKDARVALWEDLYPVVRERGKG